MLTKFIKIKFYEPSTIIGAKTFEFEVEGLFKETVNLKEEPEIEIELAHSDTQEFENLIEFWRTRKSFEYVEFTTANDEVIKFNMHRICSGVGTTFLTIAQTEQP